MAAKLRLKKKEKSLQSIVQLLPSRNGTAHLRFTKKKESAADPRPKPLSTWPRHEITPLSTKRLFNSPSIERPSPRITISVACTEQAGSEHENRLLPKAARVQGRELLLRFLFLRPQHHPHLRTHSGRRASFSRFGSDPIAGIALSDDKFQLGEITRVSP